MLDDLSIVRIATQVATANLSSQNVTSVTSSTATDSEGREALRITIIIPPSAELRIEGSTALKTLIEMQAYLQKAGEERFPIIEYATKGELAESDDH
jgi:hypothetical protein